MEVGPPVPGRAPKRKAKGWKRMINKACFVGETFTRKAPKYERFIRPMALRYKKAHVILPGPRARLRTQAPISVAAPVGASGPCLVGRQITLARVLGSKIETHLVSNR